MPCLPLPPNALRCLLPDVLSGDDLDAVSDMLPEASIQRYMCVAYQLATCLRTSYLNAVHPIPPNRISSSLASEGIVFGGTTPDGFGCGL